MAGKIPTIQSALNGGELSPDLFGRVDLDKYRRACSTMRNFFASYRGGAFSRAGTRFCGVCKQGNQGQANNVSPPRNIPFQFSVTQGIVIEAGQNYFRFLSNGGYITEAAVTITGISAFGVVSATNSYSNGDEVFLSGIQGMIQLNDRSFIVANVTGSSFTLVSTVTGLPVSVSGYPAYTSGGTAARIYTVATPYAASDLPSLKYAQSADVMSLTHPSYAPHDLTRISSNNWTLVQTKFASSIAAPASLTLAQTSSTTANFWYTFCATAVDATTGEESIASPVGYIEACDQAVNAGSIIISCASVVGAGSYNFYGGTPSYTNPPAPGALYGYIGTSFGPSFTDTNVVADFTTTPPLHTNPFATSSVMAVTMSSQGSGYNSTATTATCTSPIGQNPVLLPIVLNGNIVWTSVQSGGAGMTGGEAITFTDATASGSGASATFAVGPSTGTFPGCVAYFQERRFYASTNNNPDTYYASQPGAFTNMDSSLPVVDDDAIVGSPWSQQVNGIQWMINMPGGLVILTGLGAWQLSGGATGIATAAAVTPSNQVANPQAYNGVSPTIPPIVINYDILYVQERGSIVRNLSYNYFVNIYTGTDLTVLSNHLFTGYTIVQWAWAEEPYKLIWVVRNDGILLCLTFLKEQDVYSWSRHDTNGLFESVATVSEPPVNAPYFVVKRLIQGDSDESPSWVYMQERMDNRIWSDLEDAWCVDCALSYPQNSPNATITLSSASGVPTLQQPTVTYGGSNYSGTTFAEITDPTGSGALVSLTISGGVVTAASVSGTLTGYTNPTITVIDPTALGGGAFINILVANLATLSANANVFSNAAGKGEVGDVIRMGSRLMDVTQFVSANTLGVQVIRNSSPSIPDDPLNTAMPAASGDWTIAAPTSVVYGLDHLEGMLVSILADGVVVTPQIVANGSVTLPVPASEIVVGLGFTAQLQTMYLDIPGGITVQGRRKQIDYVVARVAFSGGPFQVGVNQPDASTQPGGAPVPWTNMTSQQVPIIVQTPVQPIDFFTGDIWTNVSCPLGDDRGQVAIQQTAPIPLNVVAVIPTSRTTDDPDV